MIAMVVGSSRITSVSLDTMKREKGGMQEIDSNGLRITVQVDRGSGSK